MLQGTLRRIDKILNMPPYNYIVHTSPFREPDNDYYHWHIEIMPKLTKVAGFEWGSGFYINPTAPKSGQVSRGEDIKFSCEENKAQEFANTAKNLSRAQSIVKIK